MSIVLFSSPRATYSTCRPPRGNPNVELDIHTYKDTSIDLAIYLSIHLSMHMHLSVHLAHL